MGLDAHVCRNPRNLPVYLQNWPLVREEGSGELSFANPNDWNEEIHQAFIACHHHIGNIALVRFLREEIAAAFGNETSLLFTKVVYNGIHGGDFIPLSAITDLSAELDELERLTQGSRPPELDCFLVQMRELVAAALREENGIVF